MAKPDKTEILKELAKRELASRSLRHFTQYTKEDYEMTAKQGDRNVHQQIIDVLERVESGEIKRLMVFCPPRLGKSELVSKRFPAWCLGRNPKRNVIVSSYGADLANDFGRKTKQIVQSREFSNVFPSFSLSDDKKEGGNWETKQQGGYYSVGVGGALTGKGGDILIIDDPVKNRQDAESPTIQKSTVDWYTSTFYTRKQSENSAIIVMQTRWNVNDLAGYLLKEQENGGDRWHVLVIQGIDEDGNEIVWPGKWSEGYMEHERSTLSPKDWAALYQQDPIASSSNIFKLSDIRYYLMSDFEKADGILKKSDLRCVMYVDPATSTRKDSDDAAVFIMAKHRITGCYYQIDSYADTSAPSKTYAAMLAMYDKATMDGFKIPCIDVEDAKLNKDQTEFIEGFRRYLRERGRYLTVNALPSKGKKEDRIKFILEPRLSLNSVFLRSDMSDGSINRKIESQMVDFPNGKHDDLIDVMALAIDRLDTVGNETKTQSFEIDYSDFL